MARTGLGLASCFVGFALVTTLPAIAVADEPPQENAATASDVVLLKSGGMVRGTIIELVPACPPGAFCSMRTTFNPSDAPYTAHASPAGPPPTIARS